MDTSNEWRDWWFWEKPELGSCWYPCRQTNIGVKWVYKTKLNEKENIEKHKARLVDKWFDQQYGVDYDETFSPIVILDTIRVVLAIATQNKWSIYQMDVKSSFLNGILEE